MELFLTNGTTQELKQLRTQICVMLKGATDFNQQSAANKLWREPVAAVSNAGDRWILTAWEHCGRVWGNPAVPCMHSDPVLPDCPPGQTVRVRGRLWFYEGSNIQDEIARSRKNCAIQSSPDGNGAFACRGVGEVGRTSLQPGVWSINALRLTRLEFDLMPDRLEQ